jgi:hypothetical protein
LPPHETLEFGLKGVKEYNSYPNFLPSEVVLKVAMKIKIAPASQCWKN